MSQIVQDGLIADVTGRICTVTFNKKVNIFSSSVLSGLLKALKEVRRNDVRAVIFTGEGSTFMAGADIKEMAGFGPKEARDFALLFHSVLNYIESFPSPTIAAVNGFALGGGCELALSCDMIFAAESAIFGQPELNLGIIPGAGGTQRLSARIGKSKAKEMIFTAEKIGAAEALSIGLADKVVPNGRLLDEAIRTARRMAEKPAHCVEGVKTLINSGSLEKEIEFFSTLFSHEEQKTLMGEFLAKKREKK